MITVGGFNTSLDKAAEAGELTLGAVNRIRDVRTYPGGKGLHVALTVAALGERVRLVGLVDDAHRGWLEVELRAKGVDFNGVHTTGSLRTNLAIRDRRGSRVTEVLEPGPDTDEETRRAVCARFLSLAKASAVAVLSGSTPPGFADDTYGALVKSLRADGVRCLVDGSGQLLRKAVGARPFLVKPNRDEAEALTGVPIADLESAVAAARSLVGGGVGIAIVSLGARGAVAADAERAVHAWTERVEAKNTVGSGDCLLGGLAVALARGEGLHEMLRLGVACGTANALSPETGIARRDDIDTLRPRVQIKEL